MCSHALLPLLSSDFSFICFSKCSDHTNDSETKRKFIHLKNIIYLLILHVWVGVAESFCTSKFWSDGDIGMSITQAFLEWTQFCKFVIVFILQSVIHLENLIKRHLPVVQFICSNQFKWQMLTWPFHEGAMSITGELVFHTEMDF